MMNWVIVRSYLVAAATAVWVGIMLALLLIAVMGIVGCGGKGSPTGPSEPVTPPTAQTVTLSGTLTALNGGQALPGVTAALGATTAQTDGTGAFTASMPPTTASTLSLTGPAIVPRTLNVAMLVSRPLQFDAIALGGQFDLGFYRQLVRNGSDAPGLLQPIRRWTQNPSLYLQTSSLVDAHALDQIEAIARDVVPQWTNHQFSIGAVERGTGTRLGQAGWLTITFSPETAHCGSSDVGRSGGSIVFYPQTRNCGCGGFAIRPTIVRHELGHSMGFYHVDSVNDIMNPVANQCDMGLSGREAYHSAIAYGRPVGNSDPDNDSSQTVNLAPMRIIQ